MMGGKVHVYKRDNGRWRSSVEMIKKYYASRTTLDAAAINIRKPKAKKTNKENDGRFSIYRVFLADICSEVIV